MKHWLALLLLCCVGLPGCSLAQNDVEVVVQVVGEDGRPISNAVVGIGFPGTTPESGSGAKVRTNSKGYASLSGEALYGVKIAVTKQGYYESRIPRHYGEPNSEQWTQEVVLREIRNPIPMYAKKTSIGIRAAGTGEVRRSLKFDFREGDYLPPEGSGADLHVTFDINANRSSAVEYEYNLEVLFPRDGDGIQPFYVQHKESVFKSSYSAPLAGYENHWSIDIVSRKGEPITGTADQSRNYYFRVNTVLDSNGNVISANYGKIYGEFPFIMYYFNPTPNDRNVEFDTSRNILEHLSFDEQVRQP